MNAFNRAFIALLALGWVAALGAAIWLVWDQGRLIEITSNSINLNFDIIADTQAEQILATIVAAALMLPALMLLMFEMKPSRRRETAAYSNEAASRPAPARAETRDDDFTDERSRIDDARRRDNVDDRDERPGGSRRWHLFPRH
jgi:hypothetical protein